MKREQIKLVLKTLLFIAATSWFLHTISKNFVVDPDFKKLTLEKTGFVADSPWFIALRVHIILAITALLAGPFGFVERLRKRNISLHRYLGRIYVISVLLNFVPSVYLSFFSTGGAWSGAGFFLLNLIWIGTTYQAYRAVRQRQIQRHRQWMIRSYSVTLANLQIYVLKTIFSKIAGMNYEIAYTVAVWSCCVIGILIAEVIIRKPSKENSKFFMTLSGTSGSKAEPAATK